MSGRSCEWEGQCEEQCEGGLGGQGGGQGEAGAPRVRGEAGLLSGFNCSRDCRVGALGG